MPTLRSRSLAAVLGVFALVAGCSSATPADDARPATSAVPTPAGEAGSLVGSPPEALAWAPCRDGFECATLVSPLDYRDPDGDTIELPVIRLVAADPQQRIGAVVLNPGGPGVSGVEFLRGGAKRFAELNRRFDLVSFDPRGVGGSEPALTCYEDGHDDRIDVLGEGAVNEARYLSRLQEERERCVEQNADLLPFVGTNNVARDLERLRIALGEPKLTYLGFSYGTRIGAVYNELFPDRVRALALDGPDDPDPFISRSVGEQYEGFELAFERLAACAAGTGTACPDRIGPADVESLFRAVERRLRNDGPLPVDPAPRRLQLGEFYYGVIGGLYRSATWNALVDALRSAAVDGDGTALQAFADSLLDRRRDGSYGNAVIANIAVNCADDPERPDADRSMSTSPASSSDGVTTSSESRTEGPLTRGRALALELPFLGPLAATAFTDCLFWPASIDPLVELTGQGSAPLLLVGTRFDPATPYAWASELARALATATVLTREGDGHTAYLASTCVRDAVNTYLVELRLPDASVCGVAG